MRSIKGLLAAAAAGGLLIGSLGVSASADSAAVEGSGEGLKPIANIPWQGGTDMETTTIKGRDYAFAASSSSIANGGGVHVIDITNPTNVKEVAWLKCTYNQGDIQISHDNKTLLLAADSSVGPEGCLGIGFEGFMLIDIRNPKKPKPIGFADTGSSHNVTAHPTKPYVYNSDSGLAGVGKIQIWNIKDPKKPELINTIRSLPHSPHDISFNADGSMAVTAAISHVDIWNTSDPENPTLLWETQCPGCSITHDAKFTPDGTGLVVGDEGGGGGAYPCPGGALYFYKLEGTETQPVPVLTGVYEPDSFGVNSQGAVGSCTSHVFDFSPDGTKVAISWYTMGTRYLDIGDMVGAAVGGHNAGNVKQLGYFVPDGGSSWSSKMHKGKYIYANDIRLGFIVYKITAK